MPHSSVNSPDEDTELPDAPQSPPDELSSDTNSPLPKTEPQSDPIESPPTPRVKEEAKEEVKEEAKEEVKEEAKEEVKEEAKEVKEEAKKEGGDDKAELGDLFADDDEDFLGDDDSADLLAPEFKVVMPIDVKPIDVKPSSRAAEPEVMLVFYQRLFPFRYLFQWLNHSPIPSNDFAHREFAFTLQNDAYLRYQAFPTFETLRKDILRLNPSRFEIGPVYAANPRDRKALGKNAFRPLTKELVFDIDLTDYDEVRTCCNKAAICIKCWQFITVAIRILDAALRDDLGFKHILWVYSGRRGAHAWVCDKRARALDDNKRRTIASYLEVVKGGSQAGKKVNVKRPLHPHIARSLDILRERFERDILRDQNPWRDIRAAERLLTLLPDRTLNDALRKKWESDDNRASVSKWADIDALAATGISKSLNTGLLKESKQDVILEYMYPRLDVEVSKHMNHLLKSPFCVHPGTGRVCVPIDSRNPEDFDPMAVPTVTELLAEIDAWERENGSGGKIHDYEKTSLKPYVDLFRTFVNALVDEETTMNKREQDADEKGNPMEY